MTCQYFYVRGLEIRTPRFSPTFGERLLSVQEGTTRRCTLVALWAHPNPSACLSGRRSLFSGCTGSLLLSPTYQTTKYPCCLCLLCVTLGKGVVRLCFPLDVDKAGERRGEGKRYRGCKLASGLVSEESVAEQKSEGPWGSCLRMHCLCGQHQPKVFPSPPLLNYLLWNKHFFLEGTLSFYIVMWI